MKFVPYFAIFICSIAICSKQLEAHDDRQNLQAANSAAQRKLLNDLKREDKCASLFLSKSYGYDIKEYKVVTEDNYVLTLHRLIHPEDVERGRPKFGLKKPYLLLHGLIGSSSSFIRNVDWRYKVPAETFDGFAAVDWALKSKNYESTVRCSAEKFNEAFEGDKSAKVESLSMKQRLLNLWPEKEFCYIHELDYDGDSLVFGREFKQAYRKYELNKSSKAFVSSSLAFTLSNFGYDVWLLNLRGNHYSREHKTPGMSPDVAEYWDFDISTGIKYDLPASIEHVKQVGRITEPMGLVSYSYTALHVLGLLTKFPQYQQTMQPVVMIAPSLLTSQDRHLPLKYFMQLTTKTLVSKNGPFPAIGRASNDLISKLICKMPLASRLCRLLETVLHGRTDNVSSVRKILIDDEQTSLMKRDADCGQTSTASLHQIVSNLSEQKINVNYIPWVKARNREMRGEKAIRRSVMLVHSETDDISTMKEVQKIRDSALKTMALIDYVIKGEPFNHPDFLFSHRNQYLVNAEIARMTTLFDYMMYLPSANAPMKPPAVGNKRM